MRGFLGWNQLTAVAAVVVAGSLTPIPSWAQLSDINTYWGSQYISSLANQQVIGGFPDGTFRPNDQVTRAQFATIVTKAFGLDTNVPPRSFVDPIPSWAAPSINAAAAANFVSGFPDGTFRPNDVLTRAQAITVLTKAAGVTSIDPAQVESVLSIYTDQGSIPNFARPPVATATLESLLVLYPNPNFINATAVATRGEVAALTYQALAKAGRVPNLPPPVGATIPGGLTTGIGETVATPTPEVPVETLAGAPTVSEIFTRDNLSTLKPGDTITVFVVGSPGATGTFSIPGIVENLPLQESRTGQYEGSYTFRTQDRAAKTSIIARLEQSGLVTTSQLPNQTITIGQVTDAVFPTISKLSPPPNSTVTDAAPEISGEFSDDKGIDLNSFVLTVNNRDVTRQAQLSKNSFRFKPSQPLLKRRPVVVTLQIADTSGNTALQEWAFTIETSSAPAPTATPTPPPAPTATPTPPPAPTATPTPPPAPTATPPAPTATPTPPPAPTATLTPTPEAAATPSTTEPTPTTAETTPAVEVTPTPEAPAPDATSPAPPTASP
ncbi:MAG: S-layer homology domain-containing protein [Cyanobacteriota bacterium]|nr:S-layer homology domain-containing protein [Cyanobacteriota bacterium]